MTSFFNRDFSSLDRPRSSEGTNLAVKSKRPAASRNVSFTPGATTSESYRREAVKAPGSHLGSQLWPREQERSWFKVNRYEQNVDATIMPRDSALVQERSTPFLIYGDAFADTIGQNPRLDLTITDTRAPYFHSGGVFVPRISTLFITSNLLPDMDPAAVSSGNRRTEVSKIEFYTSRDYSRDKVRCPERSYMAAGVAEYPDVEGNGVVICAQGSLKEPGGLVYIDTRRPHKTHWLLNNFQGRPFNSPCDIVANPVDGSLYFTDPAYGFERGFRHKPQLPTNHIYRFHPETGDCRVVANGHSRPGGLALSPDYSTLYVSELNDKYGGTTIFAYTLTTNDHADSNKPSFQISVTSNTRNGANDATNHKSTSSNSTNGSYNSSSGGSNPATYNRTAPLSPRIVPLDGVVHSSPRSQSRGPSEYLKSPGLNSRAQSYQTTTTPGLNSRSQSYQTTATSHTTKPHSNGLHLLRSSPPPQQPNPNQTRNTGGGGSGPFLSNKRLFAYTPTSSPSALISTDPRTGHLFLGTEEGVEVFGWETGDLVGKIVVDPEEGLPISIDVPAPLMSPRSGKSFDGGRNGNGVLSEEEEDGERKKGSRRRYTKGVSKVAFGGGGEFWLLGGERIWWGRMDWEGAVGFR